ncbi:sensor histidine kinase [Plantactinospora sp. CA-294935]|uniref:sensor histidine kinase n=1 Tax=Plantactinospora sp. CA-294935 TaxID=3240012 RepID=UPI003D91A621
MPAKELGIFWWLGTGAVALVLLVVSLPVDVSTYGTPVVLTFVTVTAQSAALPLLLVRPVAATVLHLAALGTLSAFIPVTEVPTWPLTVPGMIGLIAHIGLIGVRHGWRPVLALWWGSLLLCILRVVLDPRSHSIDAADTTLVVYATNSALMLIAAIVVRHGATIQRQLADARRDIAAEQSRRAVAIERTRIARELHDVVAHSMSVIHMQATSASYRLPNVDPEAKAEFVRIADGARSAIREMRQLLTVLREESADPTLAPVSRLDQLDDLVRSARRAGVPVEVRGSVPDLPETVGAAAYRIVQESLSNVIRHAPGARTTVTIGQVPDALHLEIVNESSVRDAPTSAEGGHGLYGMGERVRLLGGTLHTGARSEGGYRVAARLPIGGTG